MQGPAATFPSMSGPPRVSGKMPRTERWPSGLRHTLGKRAKVNSLPRVRIPPSRHSVRYLGTRSSALLFAGSRSVHSANTSPLSAPRFEVADHRKSRERTPASPPADPAIRCSLVSCGLDIVPKLKNDVSPLLERAIASLTLAIEVFNRPSEIARTHGVILLLHHAFELLLKAILLQRGVSVFDTSSRYTIAFDRCLELATSQIKVLTRDERSALSILDAQRDQAQHFYSELSEDILYLHAQSAVTLFDNLLNANFHFALSSRIPTRILPVSTKPPTDLTVLFDQELSEIDGLLAKGTRKSAKAAARLRAVLAFATGARAIPERVSQKELARIVRQRKNGQDWAIVLPEIAQLRLSTKGSGIPINLKIVKNASVAVRIAADGEAVVGTIIKQEVNVWDKFNLSLSDLAEKLELSSPRTLALVYELRLQDDPKCFHRLSKGSVSLKGYSKTALGCIAPRDCGRQSRGGMAKIRTTT